MKTRQQMIEFGSFCYYVHVYLANSDVSAQARVIPKKWVHFWTRTIKLIIIYTIWYEVVYSISTNLAVLAVITIGSWVSGVTVVVFNAIKSTSSLDQDCQRLIILFLDAVCHVAKCWQCKYDHVLQLFRSNSGDFWSWYVITPNPDS